MLWVRGSRSVRALCRCIMFWCSKCCCFYYLTYYSCRRREKPSPVNFWRVTFKTSNSDECVYIAWRVVLCNGACGQFPRFDTFQRTTGLELVFRKPPLFQRHVDIVNYVRGYGIEETRTHAGEVKIPIGIFVNDRPYRIFGVEPVIFACSALFLLGRGAFVAPVQAILVAIFMFTGIALYYLHSYFMK